MGQAGVGVLSDAGSAATTRTVRPAGREATARPAPARTWVPLGFVVAGRALLYGPQAAPERRTAPTGGVGLDDDMRRSS